MMVIWIFATPDSFRSVALRFGVCPSTLHFHYSYIIEALRELAPQYIRWPNAERRQQIAAAFEGASGFPGAIGCIDCTHVYITAPLENPARYRNRHHTYSLNIQAVCDHELNILDLHVGEVGSMNDNRIFRRNHLYRQLLEDNQHTTIQVDQHILGDGAYTLTDFVSATIFQLGFFVRFSFLLGGGEEVEKILVIFHSKSYLKKLRNDVKSF